MGGGFSLPSFGADCLDNGGTGRQGNPNALSDSTPANLEELLSPRYRASWLPKLREHLRREDERMPGKRKIRDRENLLDFVLLLHQISSVTKDESDLEKGQQRHQCQQQKLRSGHTVQGSSKLPRSQAGELSPGAARAKKDTFKYCGDDKEVRILTSSVNARTANVEIGQNRANDKFILCDKLYNTYLNPETSTYLIPIHNAHLRARFSQALERETKSRHHSDQQGHPLGPSTVQCSSSDCEQLNRLVQDIHQDPFIWNQLFGYCNGFLSDELKKSSRGSAVKRTANVLLSLA